jgi:PQQ-like domain
VRRKESAFVVVQVAITAAVLLLISLPISMQTTIVTSRSSTSSSLAAGSTPLWTYRASGIIDSVSVSEDGNYTAVAEHFFLNNGDGAILLFNRAGDLLWERQTGPVMSDVAISDNGSHILAIGYQFLSAPGQPTSQSYEVFALDSNGSVLWTRNSSLPYGGAISADGSRVAVFTQDSVALLTWSGQVLWNNSAAGAGCPGVGPCHVFVSQDGSLVAAGHQGITLFNSNGSVAWTYGETNQIWTNSVALTSSGYLIAAALNVNNFNGTALLLTDQGVPLWEHHFDSEVLSAALLQNGSSIGYVTYSSALFYDRAGTLLANYTTDGESTLLPTSNGTFLLGGGGNDLVLFDSAGQERWSSPLQSVLTAAVSGDGAFVAATSGPRGEGALGNSTLYFFSTT